MEVGGNQESRTHVLTVVRSPDDHVRGYQHLDRMCSPRFIDVRYRVVLRPRDERTLAPGEESRKMLLRVVRLWPLIQLGQLSQKIQNTN